MGIINDLRDYLIVQSSKGSIIIDTESGFSFENILHILGVNTIQIEKTNIGKLSLDNTFIVTGIIIYGQKKYECELLVSSVKDTIEYVLKANLIIDKAILLSESFPPALARVCWNFYSEPIDLFKNVFVKKACIKADTRDSQSGVNFNIITFYTDSCPLYSYYKKVVPNAYDELVWSGYIIDPFINPKYKIKTCYAKNLTIPFIDGKKNVDKLEMELESHIYDVYAWNQDSNKQANRCNLILRMSVSIEMLTKKEKWITICMCDIGEYFFSQMEFDNDTILNFAALDIIKYVTGENLQAKYPLWLDLDALKLSKVIFHMEQDLSGGYISHDRTKIKTSSIEGKLHGATFYFVLDIPSLPIPFFDKERGERTQMQLIIQYELLEKTSLKNIILGFYGSWKSYSMLINISFPDLYFEGRYYSNKKSRLQHIEYSGLNGLEIDDIRLYGNISNQEYGFDFHLTNKNLPSIKIGVHSFILNGISVSSDYSSLGFLTSLELSFSLFQDMKCIMEGTYERISENEQHLFLSGGLRKELSLVALIKQITGINIETKEFDFIIKSLHLLYRTQFPSTRGGMLGDPQEFSFNCAIAYDWGTGEIATTFIMHWVPDVYSYNMTASLKVLDFLLLSASCSVDFSEGEMQFRNFAFLTKLGKAQITATFDKDRNYTFKIQDFNLGELLEELIRLIDNDHDWYLPWPYTILKELSIKELEVIINNNNKTLIARYYTNFKLLFLTVQYLELFYDMANGDFLVNIQVNGSISRNNAGLDGDILGLNLLKDKFPVLKEMGEKPLHISYLAIGQHIAVSLPETFDGQHFSDIFAEIKKSVTKGGTPQLDPNNNWIAALQFKLLKAIDVSLLMCDPVFYGIEIAVGKGFEMTDPLSGLKVTILYSKVTDTIGMFYARLNFPEVFRKINLGAVQIALGEVAVAIYTNGNFKVDLGFPWEKNFSRSFGLTYMYFTGQGGFYLGVLNGDTSKQLPAISKGNFGNVLELGIGINAGVGLEINAGPLKAGAYVKLVAIFQGVFASYMSEKGDNTTYYRVQATAGVTASLYGSIDFVLIQVGFSVNASILADLTLERYKQTELALALDISVNAYIKILFIKIKFDFHFHWTHKFLLGENELAPWEIPNALYLGNTPEYELEWSQQQVLSQKRTVPVEIVPFFSYDGVEPEKEQSGEGRIAFLALLHGYEAETRNLLGYSSISESPFGIILQVAFLRALHSVKVNGKEIEEVTPDLLLWLEKQLEQVASFHTGFGMDRINEFLDNNLELSYRKGENNYGDNLIEGIPFPLSPYFRLEWYSDPDTTLVYELDKEPAADYGFINRLQEYYAQLAVDTEKRLCAFRDHAEMETAGGFMFSQYFYMVTRIAVHVVKENFPVGTSSLSFQAVTDLLLQEKSVNTASGMTSRFQYGGSRVLTDNGRDSLYSFACQQFRGLKEGQPDKLWHKMVMSVVEEAPVWMKLDTASAIWEFYEKDMNYPKGMLGTFQPQLMPYYKQKVQTLELRNPNGVSGDGNMTFLEAETVLAGNCRVVLRSMDNEREVVYKKGILLYLSLTKVGDGIYRINTIGYDGIEKLNRIGKVTGIDIYRTTSVFDEDRKGFCPVCKEVFLYRTNLCLEAEKPELKLIASDTEYENSAFLEEYLEFLGLLKDASLVNSKGYYIRMGTAEKPADLPEGCDSLVLWIETDENPDAVLLLEAYDKETEKPLVYTDKTYAIPVLRQGTLAFTLTTHPEGTEDSITNLFQMLDYRIEENVFFNQSHESTPLFAEHTESCEVYSQIVPVYRLAKNGNDSPYSGIQEGSKVTLAFSLIDILGNKSSKAAVLEVPVGYTDPLLSPVVWPHTRCVYTVEQISGGWNFVITFSWKDVENELPLGNEDDKELIETAFWQMNCHDIQVKAIMWNKEYEVDPLLLKQYVTDLRDGKKPADVVYRIGVNEKFSEEKEIDLSFGIFRDQNLVDASIRGSHEERNVREAVVKVKEDCEDIARSYLARCGQDGTMFLLEYPSLELSDPKYFTLPPLYNQLVNIQDANVWQIDGSNVSMSFYNVDMEVWADLFLSDMEEFLQPESPYSYSRDTLEGLLKAKKILAENIAAGVCMIYDRPAGRDERAKEFYRNELLKNLYQGRKYDVCVVANASCAPEENKAYTLSAKIEDGNYTVKSGKVRSDGVVAIGLHAKDIARKAQDDILLEYSVSDKEICKDGNYEYLAWQQCKSAKIRLKVPLLYKRFPQAPALMQQGYQVTEKLFGWKYKLQFSQETPAQDVVTIRLITDRIRLQDGLMWQLPVALARYMYLRDKFLQPGADAASCGEMLVRICQDIADTWSYNLQSKHSFDSMQKVMLVHRDPAQGTLQVDSEQIVSENIQISIKMEDGSFSALDRNGSIFKLPETGYVTPVIYEFIIDGFDIRETQQINALLSVTRNQLSEDIASRFIYETEKVSFTQPLLPVIKRTETISMGSFEIENFVTKLTEIVSTFDRLRLETYCAIPIIGHHGEQMLYSYVPVNLIPMTSVEDLKDFLQEVYLDIQNFLKENQPEAEGEICIVLSLSLVNGQDEDKNVVDFRSLSFTL